MEDHTRDKEIKNFPRRLSRTSRSCRLRFSVSRESVSFSRQAGEAVAEEDEVEEREKERDARRCSRRRVINDAR